MLPDEQEGDHRAAIVAGSGSTDQLAAGRGFGEGQEPYRRIAFDDFYFRTRSDIATIPMRSIPVRVEAGSSATHSALRVLAM
jgi:hypothetical protein